MKKINSWLIISALIILVALAAWLVSQKGPEQSPNSAETSGISEKVITVATPPDPNSIPLLVLKAHEKDWLKKDGYNLKIKIKLAPGGDPSAMKAMLHSKQVDLALFNNIGAAKFYSQGEKHLKLLGVHVWKGVYILTQEKIKKWGELNNSKGLAVPAIKTPPHLWSMRVLKKHNVKNVQFVGAGMGQALFAVLSNPKKSPSLVVAPEPAVNMILLKQKKDNWKVRYKIFADVADELNPDKGVALGATILVNNELEKKDIDIFIEGFERAITEVNNKDKLGENSRILAKEWKEVFNQELSPEFFETLLKSGRLGLDFRKSSEIKDELLKTYGEFNIEVDDNFFFISPPANSRTKL